MLRDYQTELLNKTFQAFREGYRRPLVVAPCGAGKSYLFVELIKRTRGEALILTHRQELKEQHERLMEELGATNARVAMILTEANRLGEYPRPELIVTDEAHLSRSNSWMKVIDYYDSEANPLFEIAIGDKQHLIPAQEEFIAHIDFDKRAIKFVLPEGLLDL